MNKIKKFIDNEILLTPSAYEEIKDMKESKIKKLLDTDTLFLENIESKENEDEIEDNNVSVEFKSTLEIIKGPKNTSGKYKISQFVDHYNNRFSKLKGILKERVDTKKLISINKLSSYGLEGTIIGIVREVNDDYVLIEDNTSSVKIDTKENLVEDEVIGVKGKKNKEKFVAEKIYYPDLSFKRDVNTLQEEKNALFISDLNSDNIEGIDKILSENNVSYLFIVGKINLEKMDRFKEMLDEMELESVWVPDTEDDEVEDCDRLIKSSNPSWCSVSDEMMIFQYFGKNFDKYKKKLDVETSRDLTLKLLKKRHLDPSGKNFFNDTFLLDELPDIIHCGNLNDFSIYNYKGTTVVNTTPERSVLVNFGNREVEEVDLKNI
ncbi:MAG: hypothetical protein ABEK17_00605 [Candidatus Aenigmatarchaeota archaeon]